MTRCHFVFLFSNFIRPHAWKAPVTVACYTALHGCTSNARDRWEFCDSCFVLDRSEAEEQKKETPNMTPKISVMFVDKAKTNRFKPCMCWYTSLFIISRSFETLEQLRQRMLSLVSSICAKVFFLPTWSIFFCMRTMQVFCVNFFVLPASSN